MTVAGAIMVMIGAPLGVWVSAQNAGPDPTPTAVIVGGGVPDAGSVSDSDPEASAILAEAANPTPSARATTPPEDAASAPSAATATPTTRADTPTPAPTATAEPTEPPTPTPEPTFSPSSEPECAVSDEAAVPDQPLTLTCSGFEPGKTVKVYWEGIKRSLTSFEPSSGGTGKVTFAVPDVRPGNWYTRASDGDDRAAVVRLRVTNPRMSIQTILGDRGDALTVDISGYRAEEKVAIRWYGLEGDDYSTLDTVTVSEEGSASVELDVPSRSGYGRHRIGAVGETSGVVIERMFWVIAPGEPVNFFQGTTGCNRIALIFNVGIGNEADASVLETLEREDVPATMFVMGWWPERFPDSFQRLVDGGYIIASHGYNAVNLTTSGDDQVRREVQAAEDALTAAMGRPPAPWFTPYAGTIDDRARAVVASEGYVPVGWRITTDDWSATITEDQVYNTVINGAYDGAIVEFHLDGPATGVSTGRALPRIIDTLRERGYEFVTIPQLEAPCGTPAANGGLPVTIDGEPQESSADASRPAAAVLTDPPRSIAQHRRRAVHS